MNRTTIPLIASVLLTTGFSAQAQLSCDALEVTASALNVRTGPSTGSSIVGSIQNGEKYVKTSDSGDWAEIWFDSQKRWISAAAYTNSITADCGKVTAGTLNIRSGAGTGYSIGGTAPQDSLWVLTGSSTSEWDQIYYESELRWAYSAYLDTEGDTPAPPISVSNFEINDNDATTDNQYVYISATINGSPASELMMSEDANFSDANWVAYTANPSFSLSAGNGTKTLYYRVKNAQGRVSQTVSDTIDLDIAPPSTVRTIDPVAWFDEYGDQFGSLSQSQVDGINFLLTNMELDQEAAYTNLTVYQRQMAYLWATVKHEVANTYMPITEYGNTYCHNYSGGCTYKGRGYVQLTHDWNYRNMTPHVNRILGINVDLEANPLLALDPDIAYTVMSYGSFNGVFTGKTIGQYIKVGTTDYWNARRVINGTDKASLLQGYAQKFQAIMEGSTL